MTEKIIRASGYWDKEGNEYDPQARIECPNFKIPENLKDQLENLAAYTHDIWAAQRISEGWTYGEKRDDGKKKQPDLKPYIELPEKEKEYDRQMAAGVIRIILIQKNYREILNEWELAFAETINETVDLDITKYADLIGESPQIQGVRRLIDLVAPSDESVLITGESGTGKELVANLIWRNSERSDKIFIQKNIAVFPLTGNLLELTLFGNVKDWPNKGEPERKGIFEKAEGGIIFLDEIARAPISVQTKLLRLIEERKVERMGGEGDPIDVDFRLISATNKNLKEEVKREAFLFDLYYRINVVNIEVPPLRDRIDDIPLLAFHFLNRLIGNERMLKFSYEAMTKLKSYHWPGNVRELANVIRRSIVLTPKDSEFIEIII